MKSPSPKTTLVPSTGHSLVAERRELSRERQLGGACHRSPAARTGPRQPLNVFTIDVLHLYASPCIRRLGRIGHPRGPRLRCTRRHASGYAPSLFYKELQPRPRQVGAVYVECVFPFTSRSSGDIDCVSPSSFRFCSGTGLAPASRLRSAATHPPACQPPPAQTSAQPSPRLSHNMGLTSPAGSCWLLADQTAVFEEFVTKLKAGLAKSADPTLKQQAAGFKIYKAAEPFGTNALYVVTIEPVVPSSDYELFDMLRRTMTPEELRAPEAAEMWKRYANAFASGPSRLSLTPVGGQ